MPRMCGQIRGGGDLWLQSGVYKDLLRSEHQNKRNKARLVTHPFSRKRVLSTYSIAYLFHLQNGMSKIPCNWKCGSAVHHLPGMAKVLGAVAKPSKIM